MANLSQIFGQDAAFLNGFLLIPNDRLVELGLSDPESANGEEVFAAIVKGAYDRFFRTNTDESVQASIDKSVNAPFARNSVDRTQFSYNCQFFASYVEPFFDPDDL